MYIVGSRCLGALNTEQAWNQSAEHRKIHQLTSKEKEFFILH